MTPGDSSEIHRCRRFVLRRLATETGSVVLKSLSGKIPVPRWARLMHNEYAVLSKLDVPGVERPIALEGPEDAPTLVLEDAGCEDLEQRLSEGPLPVESFFDIALQLADVCARIHAQGVVHRAIAPSHVVLGTNGKVTLVHFIDAAELASVARILEPEQVAALAWASPEQTGRMNWLVDWRADLYSLGATFYAMLTGAPPFRSTDPLELVHAHLAKMPVAASVANPRVPQVLSDIVQRLLTKMPERRYQSAEALAADLREARRQWLATGTIEPFELGRLDLARELPFPERLYGRDRELAVLGAALDRVRANRTELVLVAGEAGSGKTALVGAVRDAAAQGEARFVSGKFDLRAANMPYASVVEALRALARALLAEPMERRAEESLRLKEAVQANGRVLIDLIPELRDVFGELSEIPALGPVETENRFHVTLQAFIRAVAAERPLVFFLDDLQWTDAASLRVLRALAADPESRHVLLLGAFRTREVGPKHPLLRTLEEIRSMGTAVTRLEVGPLETEALVALLADVLRCEPERARPLVELVQDKTAGNPFFVRQLLRSLQRGGLLVFDETRGTWLWELHQIEQVEISENVVELMTAAIRRLSDEAQRLLQLAACIGKRVELQPLAAAWGRTVDEMASRFGEVLREGLLVPEDERAQRAEPAFRFIHDRVQQAAYALLSEEQRKQHHLRIGSRFLELFRDERLDEKLFDVVDQLNLGSELLAGTRERDELARLNYRAGVRARRSAAYGPALAYFRSGLALLPGDSGPAYDELSFLLHRDAAECASLTGEHDLCRKLVAEALRHVGSMTDAADLHALRISSATVTGEYEAALQWGWEAMRTFFGTERPRDGFAEQIAAQREAIDVLLAGRSPGSFVDQPLMTRPEARVYMKLVSAMVFPAWFVDRQLLLLLTAQGVRFTLEHGNCSDSIMPYAVYAQLLLGMGELRAAEGFSRLAVDLARKFEDRLQEIRAFQLYNNFVRAWLEPLSVCASGAHQVFEMGLQYGEFQNAVYGCTMIVIYSFTAGLELDHILAELDDGLGFCRQVRSEGAILNHLAYRQAIRCLKGLTRGRNRFDDDEFDEPAFLVATRNEPTTECMYNILRLQTSYLFRDFAEARVRLEAAARGLDFLGGYIPSAEYTFFAALALLALCDGATPEERGERLARVAALREKLRRWEEGCAENFRHKRLLVDAELARVEGRVLEATGLYDQAIEGATKARFPQDRALADELCGRLYSALGRTRVAHVYLGAAQRGWARWGALDKARALDDEFGLSEGDEGLGAVEERTPGTALDALSLLKTAETISSEIVLERLLGKLMEVCIQAAGAERGVLVVEEEDGPFVRAVGGATLPVSTDRTPLGMSRELPREVIQHVRETRRVLVLDDASRDQAFASDPYLARGHVRSVLVLPIQRQETLLGTFFFENDLTPRAFTRERVRVLELLSSQIAIALENSLLFEKLKVEVEERTRAERAVRFLSDVSALLAESLDYATTLRRLARFVAPAFADWCVVDVVETGGKLRRLAGVHADPRKERILRELEERYPPDWGSPHPSARVVANGKPLVLSELTEAVLQPFCRDAEHLRLIQGLGSQSVMTVPLVARGRRLGAISVGTADPRRPFGPADQALAEELARRAAIAIDNAHLYQEAQEGIRIREEFLGVAAHELKTPITSMNIGLQAVIRRRERPSEERVMRVLQATDKQVRRLMRLVDDVLDVSRLHAGRLELYLERVDLVAVVADVMERFDESIVQSGSQVDVRADAAVVGLWDRSRLDQVVANLLGNALKFGEGKPIELSIARRGGSAELAVVDHGIGISPERLPHIFERFERAVPTRHYGGFGLGLYIVRSITEALGGSVHVESTPGQGSTFTVVLPCGEATRASASGAEAPPSPGEGEGLAGSVRPA
ncbi:AAA family ATPase [Vitiosangium sp. GDMCC 1.1324]|uniref:AAA family ATPase n=1 Tax=Vitiosangium sp. (strain GDMCC 1.1324) TaxID=2138576 RepID=UPI00130EB34F|nr:AAA family ATPase [Vitiosangium sp. GDMCC 1.1324]